VIKVDTTTLSDVINQCFAFATDGRFTPAQQNALLADGKRLRGLLLNLISAQFNDGTQAVLDANQRLTAVNTLLSNSASALANVAQTLNNVASLVSTLDKLLNVAAGLL
jgi:hypothetical protein